MGAYEEIHFYNKEHTENYDHRVLSYVRWNEGEKVVVVSNFDSERSYEFELKIPGNIIEAWDLTSGSYEMDEMLYGSKASLQVSDGIGKIKIALSPLESVIYQL